MFGPCAQDPNLFKILQRPIAGCHCAIAIVDLGKGEGHAPLAAEDHNRVLFTSLRHDDLKAAEKAFERLRSCGDELLTTEACRLLAEEFDKRLMAPKARHYRQLLQTYS